MAPPFSLDAVLRLRERKQEAEERILVAIGAERRQFEDMLRRIEQELSRWTAQRVEEVGTVCNALTQQGSYARYKMLSEAKVQLTEQIRHANARHQEQQKKFLAARSEREMLANLKSCQRSDWETENSRREARAVEDLFTARRTRK